MLVTRGRRCPFAAWCIGIRLRVGRITTLCFVRYSFVLQVMAAALPRRPVHSYAKITPYSATVRSMPCRVSASTERTGVDAPHACPDCARTQCCVAPCVCFAASKRVARRGRRTRVPFASKPRATASFGPFRAIGTGLALRLAIGSTWIRCECNTKYSPQYRSGQRRPPNSVIDWVRGTPFLFPESLSPPAARRRSQPATLRKPRS